MDYFQEKMNLEPTITHKNNCMKEKSMKLLISVIVVLVIFAVPQAFAYNSLQDTELYGDSAVVSLDVKFGKDTYKELLTKTIVTNHLDEELIPKPSNTS